jgi:hypothetical protein
MQDRNPKILLYQQRLVGLGYLAVAVLLPYWIFVGVGAISLGWEVLWHLLPLSFLGIIAIIYWQKMENYETVIKDLGNDLYEISCYPAVCFMFEVVEYAEVGKFVSSHQGLAYCTTEELWFNLSVDFDCKIIEVNQALIDLSRSNPEMLSRKPDDIHRPFSQTDWICRVQKLT